jgi:hypothetical protein
MGIFRRISEHREKQPKTNPSLDENFMTTKPEKYALFFWHCPEMPQTSLLEQLIARQGKDADMEPMAPLKPPPKKLVFIKMVDSAVELSSVISRSPTLDYVIMQGSLHAVKASTSVFVDGKNLMEDQLNG